MTVRHSVGAAVDEMFQSRHELAGLADVESPSRAAGGFPTLGGGMRGATPRMDTSGRVASTAPTGAAKEAGA